MSGILALFALTIVGLFLTSIRGGTKAEVVQKVRQDGDFALKTMSRLIRQAAYVGAGFCNESGLVSDQIIVYDWDGNPTTFELAGARIASNSSYLTGVESEASGLSFTCYDRSLGNQVVTIKFVLSRGTGAAAQAQEKQTAEFKTSVSLRSY